MPVRDPSSADPNAQAPADHPDAQVRVDQSVKLTGVQAPKYAPTNAELALQATLAQQAEAEASAAPNGEAAGDAVAHEADGVHAASAPHDDPIPDGEVTPDAGTDHPSTGQG